jgi:hypothetical protein
LPNAEIPAKSTLSEAIPTRSIANLGGRPPAPKRTVFNGKEKDTVMAEKLSQKLAKQDASQSVAPAADLTTNPEIQAKIDGFKAENPKYMEYLKTLPRDRLENIAVLRRIETNEQKERIQAATERKLGAWLAQHPDAAQRVADRVAKISPEKQAGARVNLIRGEIQKNAFQSAGVKP